MIVVVDLELTCWNSEERGDKKSEIIEIGAVKVDLDKGEIVDQFQCFVRPTNHLILSNYCKELTHITQDDVNKAKYFWEIYPGFVKWFGSRHKNIFASWGSDQNALKRDCQLHGLEWKLGHEQWNIKTMFSERYGKNKMGLSAAIENRGLVFEGVHHRAISDAHNTARLLIGMFHPERSV